MAELWLTDVVASSHVHPLQDNVRFHTVIFPSCLLGTGDPWTMLHHISTTEYLQYESGKFSKSRNIGVFGDKAEETGVPASVWRYYLLANRPESADSQFIWRDFVNKNNGELLANLGNFVNRVLTFTAKKYDSKLPQVPAEYASKLSTEGPLSGEGDDIHAKFIRDVNEIIAQYVSAMDAVKLRLGLQTLMQLSARGNLYLSEVGLDNSLFTNKRAECDVLILLAVNLIWVLSSLVHPFMPETADQMCAQLNAPPRVVPFQEDSTATGVAAAADADGDGEGQASAETSKQQQQSQSSRLPITPGRGLFALDLQPTHTISKPSHLFKRIEDSQADAWRAKFGGETAAKSATIADAPSKAPSGVGKTGTGQQDGQAGLSKKAMAKLEKEKKKAAHAAWEAAQPKVKSEEMLDLEKRIEEQGKKVRDAKDATKNGKSAQEAGVDDEVSALLKLKSELEEVTAKVKALEVQDVLEQAK